MNNSSLIATSTTDTPEQVRAAMEAHGYSPEPESPGGAAVEGAPKQPPESPEAAEPAEEGKSAAAPGAAEEIQEPEEPEEPGTGKPKGKGGFQKRIDKLTREKREAEAKADRLERDLAEKTAAKPAEPAEPGKPAAEPEVKPPEAKPKPKLEDFETYEDFVEALTDWKSDQKLDALRSELKAEKEAQAAAAARQPLIDAWAEKLDAARERHPDYDEVTGTAEAEKLELTPAMHQAIFESELGPDICYQLGKNPEEFRRIAGLAPVASIREIGRIEAAIEAESGNRPEKKPAKTPDTKSPETKPAKPAALPAPITPVKGAAAAEKDPRTMTTEEYFAWEQSRKKSRAA